MGCCESSSFEPGDKVEAWHGGKRLWCKAKITMVHYTDGTYDVLYEDGTKDIKVKNNCVRWRRSFERGDKVEARYGGKSKWCKGKITMVCYDGTYDVLYEDGTKEIKVKKNWVRRRSGFERGDKVEARFSGKGLWWNCEISMVNDDGTYDVLYGDGTTETKVKKNLVRRRREGDCIN